MKRASDSKDPRKVKWRRQAAGYRPHPATNANVPDIDKTRPGIFVTCPRGREKQAAREALDLFDSLLAKLYPSLLPAEEDDEPEGDIEAAMAAEVSEMAQVRPTFERRNTDTACLLFFATPAQVDPIRVCEAAVQDLVEHGVPRYKCIQRLTPITAFASAISAEDVDTLARATLSPLFSALSIDVRWRIDFTSRSHTKPLSRDYVLAHIGELAQSMLPPGSLVRVDLTRPTHVLVIEAFKHLCGMSLVSAEWYEGPALDDSSRGAGKYRRFGLGSIADDLVKTRAKQNGVEHVMDETRAS